MNRIKLIILIALAGCTYKSSVNKQLDKVNRQDITIGNVQLTAKILPGNLTENTPLDTNSHILYFNVRIDKNDKERFEKNKILYLDFDMQHDFILNIGKDSIASSFCQKIENGRSNSYEYIVAFETERKYASASDVTLVYNDKIFGVGSVAFVCQQTGQTNYKPKS